MHNKSNVSSVSNTGATMVKKLAILLLILAPSLFAQQQNNGNSYLPGTGNAYTGYNIKNYGAVGDAKYSAKVAGVTTQTTLTDTENPWLASDVGKFISCTNPTTNLKGLVTAVSTIVTFNSAGSIVVSSNTTAALTNAQCVWFTADDTAAITAAFAAARSGTTQADSNSGANATPQLYYPNNVYCPAGGYAVSANILNQTGTNASPEPGVGFIGAGRSACKIYYLPSSTGTTLFNYINVSGVTLRDFSINGMNFNFHNFTASGLIEMNNVARLRISDVDVVQFGDNLTPPNGGAAFQVVNTPLQTTCVIDGVSISNAPSISTNAAFYFVVANGCIVENSLAVFNNASAYINDSGGFGIDSNGEFPFVFLNDNFEECTVTTGCMTIVSGSGVQVIGGWYLASISGGYAFSVDTTSALHMTDAECVGFSSTNTTLSCFSLAGSAQLNLKGDTLLSNGAGQIVSAPSTATVIDGGGNTWQNCQSGTCTAISPANYATFGLTGGIIPTAALGRNTNTCYAATGVLVATQNLCTVLLDKNYQVLNITAQSGGAAPVNSACVTAPVVTISDGTRSATLTLTTGKTAWASNVDASTIDTIMGTGTTLTVSLGTFTCATPPTNLAVTYALQSVLNP
jgi:hypothetical protein